MADPIQAFFAAMREAGLSIDETITADGRLHRFNVEGDKRGKRNGWYVLHLDGLAAGSFGSWRTGESHQWCTKAEREMSNEEREQNRLRIATAKAEREAEEAKLREVARLKAEKLWARAGSVDSAHPYLAKKGIRPVGIKQLNNMLVVPVRDADGALHSLQFISADGSKRFLTGGRKAGCYAAMGEPMGALCIAEGYATGVSIHHATEYAVAVAFDAGNLAAVAKALRAKFPDIQLIVCADDDHQTPGNPGITKATEAARAVGGLLAVPDFGSNRPDSVSDFNDLHQHGGQDAVCGCVARAIEVVMTEPQAQEKNAPKRKVTVPASTSETSVTESWPPLLLPGTVRPPEIPADILPGWAGAMAAAVAADTQTSPSASVLLALPMIAACVQRRYEVAPHGDGSYREPLCLWTLAALPSGSRKTPILKALSDPLRRWEKLLADRLRAEIARVEATRRVMKKRIEALEAKAAKVESSTERASIRDEIQRELEETPEELKVPRLMTGDTTPERLQEMLVEQHERMSLVSDEAGIFLVLGGMYSGGQANLDVFLQAYSGSSVRVDRKGRMAHLESPALTFALALQPGILQDVANDKRFHDSGLLARFLFCIPQSTVGARDVRARNPIPDHVAAAWREGLFSLLLDAEKRPDEPRLLSFTNEARECWLDFAQKVENELASGGKLAHFAEWGAKLPGQCARIAGLMQLIATGRESKQVGLDAVQRAVKLSGLLVKHAYSAFRLLGADKVEADAIHLMEWIKARGLDEFDRNDAHRAMEGRFRTVARLKEAAERLHEWNVLSPELRRSNHKARPSPYYRVNHQLFGKS
ncbi:MAG: DUF3987 domain-containing protein [Nitrosomonadales bacterium]|nr:DUF3987 domain-containing protein [Nitrosomonadales bacterium]